MASPALPAPGRTGPDRRQALRHGVRVGLARGWTEFVQSLRSPQDQGFYLFMAAGSLVYLWFQRDDQVPGTSLSLVSVALPSLLAGLVVFSLVIGPAYSLAMEREDGTLLRAKAVPNGIVGYVAGQVVLQTASLVPMLATIVVPSFLLFDDVAAGGGGGWLTTTWVLVLGILATLPIGMVIGALVPSAQKVGTWGMLPVLVLTAVSGIFVSLQSLWGWVQVVAQAFPTYWVGLGMRSAFLPDEAAAMEIGGSWRTTETVLVLVTWAVAGLLVTPVVLRRMARRTSGSQVEAAKQAAVQWGALSVCRATRPQASRTAPTLPGWVSVLRRIAAGQEHGRQPHAAPRADNAGTAHTAGDRSRPAALRPPPSIRA